MVSFMYYFSLQHYEANAPVQLLSIEPRHSVSSLVSDHSSRESTPVHSDAPRELTPPKIEILRPRVKSTSTDNQTDSSTLTRDSLSSNMTTPNGTSNSRKPHVVLQKYWRYKTGMEMLVA